MECVWIILPPKSNLPWPGLLKFKKNMDVDGFVPDLSDEMSVSEVVYQVTLTTTPGQARFEASLTYSIKLDTFSVKVCVCIYLAVVVKDLLLLLLSSSS